MILKTAMATFAIIVTGLPAEAQYVRTESAKGQPDKKVVEIDPRMFYPAHVMIEVESFDSATGLYHIKRPTYPNANSIYAKPENLALAITSLNIKDLNRKPNSIVGSQFSTDKPLLVIDKNDPLQGKNAKTK